MMRSNKVFCEMCKNECNLGYCGNSISVWFPNGHPLYSSNGRELDSTHKFCSSECLIDYIVLHEYNPDDVEPSDVKPNTTGNDGIENG